MGIIFHSLSYQDTMKQTASTDSESGALFRICTLR